MTHSRVAAHDADRGQHLTLGPSNMAAWDRAELLANPARRTQGVSMRRRANQVIRPVQRGVVRFRLAALFAAQFFDLGTFSLMVDRHGIVAEANPLVAQGFADWGMVLVVVAKLALVLLVGSIVVLLAGRPTRRTSLGLAAVVTVVAVVAGFTGGVSNLATL